jgi:DNA-binding LytR/AlgR family response regulator
VLKLLGKAAPSGDWEAELGRPFWWARALGFSAIAGLTLGVIGFLSGELLICLFDWTAMVVFGAAIAALGGPPLVRLGRRLGLPAALSVALAVVLTSVPVSAFAAAFGHLAWPKPSAALTPLDWFLKTLFVEALIVGLWALSEGLLRARPRSAPAREPVTPGPASTRASDEAVFCLQMQDHYVRVHRPSGVTMELMSMKAAIARYGAAGGLQVHRSWWVARAAIGAVERHGRGFRLRVNGGLTVPVARNRIAELRTLSIIPE